MVQIIPGGLQKVATSNIVDGAVTAIKLADAATWKLLGETVLASPATHLAVTGLAGYKYLKGVFQLEPSVVSTHKIQFNDDTGNNYDYRWFKGGSSYATGTAAATDGLALIGTTEFELAGDFTITNLAAIAKQAVFQTFFNTTAEALYHTSGRWDNTAAQITKMDMVFSANLDAGSKLAVFGWNE